MAGNSQLAKQNDLVISLLGRLAFPEDRIREIVSRSKRNPERYVQGYNACDGTRTLSEIAKIIGVAKATLSPILQQWENLGIVYEVERAGGKFYKKLYPI